MSRTSTTFAPLLLGGLLVLAGCAGSGAAPPAPGAAAARFPMTVETCGREVTIERPPERVVTVGSEAPALVWAAGAADQIDALIAVFSPLGPAEAAYENVPVISPGEEPTKEVILGQEPDLLLGYGLTNTPWEEVERLGIDQIVVSGQCDGAVDDGPTLDRTASFQDIYDDIELYGRIFGTEDVAARAVADLRERVAAVEERFRGAPQRTAAVLAPYPGAIYVYGHSSISEVQLETLGLTNAFADVQDRYISGKLVAIAQDPDSPLGAAASALAQVPNFAPEGSPSRESIIAQEPDLVISWGLFETTPDALEQAGIDSYELSGYCDETSNPDKGQDYEDVYHDIELFGQLFGSHEKAASQIEELRQRVQAVRDRVGSAPERTVGVLYVSDTTLLAYNKSTMAHTQLDILGLTNVFADVTGDAHAEISLEEVIARDPDQIVLLSYEQTPEQARQALLAKPGIEKISAVRDNRIYVHPLVYSKPSLLAVEGLEQMTDQILAPLTGGGG